MARQSGIILLEGTIGNITFVKTANGYFARRKGGVSGERIRTDPAFARTRENSAEFGTAGKTGRLLRTAFRSELLAASDKKITPRLLQQMVRILQTDNIHPRGLRKPAAGNLTLLKGFECNRHSPLGSVYGGTMTIMTNRPAGSFTLTLPPFVPAKTIRAPAGATHFSFMVACSAVDFDNGTCNTDHRIITPVPWNNREITIPDLTCSFPAGSTLPLFGVLGIRFCQEVNGDACPLNNSAYNALAIVSVDL